MDYQLYSLLSNNAKAIVDKARANKLCCPNDKLRIDGTTESEVAIEVLIEEAASIAETLRD